MKGRFLSTDWRAFRWRGVFWLGIACLLLMPGAQAQSARAVPTSSPATPPYEIQVGDVLEVNFFKTPELNQTRTVGPDGSIQLMLIGTVRAAHRSIDDLSQELLQRYGRELVEPDVNLFVKDYSGLQVYLGGEINQPGVVPFKGGLTLLQALMNAGGFKETARLEQVILIRRGPDQTPISTVVNVKRILRVAQFEADPLLQPLDVIFVPRSKIANINLFVQQFIENNLPIPFFFSVSPGG